MVQASDHDEVRVPAALVVKHLIQPGLKARQRRSLGRHVLAHFHFIGAHLAGNDDMTILGFAVFFGKPGIQRMVRRYQERARQRRFASGHALLQLALGFDMRQRHSLQPGYIRLVGKFLP